MSFHPDSTFKNPPHILSLVHGSSGGPRAVTVAAVTILTLVAITFLDAWPQTLKRKIWIGLVYLTPSSFIYAMEYASRKSHFGVQNATKFGRKDFGNPEAKGEALGRLLGYQGRGNTAPVAIRKTSGKGKALSEYVPNPPGLGNWDNSCYQNTVIQSLSSLTGWKKYLDANIEMMPTGTPQPTHEALVSIIDTLNDPENRGRRQWIPSALKSMNSWQQQDAQEYFSKVTDAVDNELISFLKKQPQNSGLHEQNEDKRDFPRLPRNPFHGLLAQRVGCRDCGFTEGLSLLPFTCLTVNLDNQRECDIRQRLDEYTTLESIEGVECIKCTVQRTKVSLEKVLSNLDEKPTLKDDGQAGESLAALKKTVASRLGVIDGIFDNGDFSDPVLYKKLNVSDKGRVSSTKSKQAVIARAPECLTIHVNRSIFDSAGYQRKNNAPVRFPSHLDLGKWSLGSNSADTEDGVREVWETNPERSMLAPSGAKPGSTSKIYELRALITHYGLHEDGHYISYRKTLSDAEVPDSQGSWFGFSDHIVFPVSEEEVLSQGGVFMLFYEAAPPPSLPVDPSVPETKELIAMHTSETTSTQTVVDSKDDEALSQSTTTNTSDSDSTAATSLSPTISPTDQPMANSEQDSLESSMSHQKDGLQRNDETLSPIAKSGEVSSHSPTCVISP